MVVDTAYYELLDVPPDAPQAKIKQKYRKLAFELHPDRNPGDVTAKEKFQALSEAYEVISDPDRRVVYDKYGKEQAKPDNGFTDPGEFFSMIFGGEAFVDWVGEISLMKDLTKTMDITMKEMEEEEGQAAAGASASAEATDAKTTSESASAPDAESAKPTAQPPTVSVDDTTSNFETLSTADTLTADQPSTRSKSPSPSGTSTPRSRTQIPTRLAILDKSEEEARLEAAGVTEQEKELREKQKKKGLTKEQREELAAYERERQRIRDERVDTLSQKLIDRLSAWTETDKSHDVTKAFQEQMRLTVDNLKMESFGIEIMHAIGATYISKASAFIKSQKFLGIQGFWSRLKDKGTLAKETWGTISTAIDAQMTMEEMAKAEEKGGEDWTDERKAEFEKRVTGKILAAAWRGSKFEIQGVLRDVCDKVLGDKKVPLDKRMERAQGLLIIGEIFQKAARNPDEEGEYMAFEQLMAEAAVKKDKGEKKSKKSRKEDSSHHSHHHGRSSEKQSEASAQSEKA